MTIEVPGGGAGLAALTMPMYSTTLTQRVGLKSAAGTVTTNLSAAFWTAIDLSHTHEGYEAVKLVTAADTTEQTIVDVAGSGVLTSAFSPQLSGAGTATIRVYIDSSATPVTFLSETLTTGGQLVVGGFSGANGTSTAANSSGIGSSVDSGFGADGTTMMLTPPQVLLSTNIGMVFKSNLKVTVQCSVNPTGTTYLENGVACYHLSIPEGLV